MADQARHSKMIVGATTSRIDIEGMLVIVALWLLFCLDRPLSHARGAVASCWAVHIDIYQ